jgi:hypothetical protein
MFERFTNRSRKVMAFANIEAIRRGYTAIDTEHILLALAIEGRGVGANALKSLPAGLKACDEIQKSVNPVIAPATHEKLAQTPQAKKVIEYAMQESSLMNHTHVGTEHLLLGLLRETRGKAAQVLENAGITIEQIRPTIQRMLASTDPGAPLPAIVGPPSLDHISYRSAVELFGGPSLSHIFVGMVSGFFFLIAGGATLLMTLIPLKALFQPSWIFPGMPPYSHPVFVFVVSIPMTLLCLFASWIMLRMTIRQFSPRHLSDPNQSTAPQ